MSRFSARSVPLHTPVWVTVWSEKNGKSKPLQRVLKNEKTVQITWICTAVVETTELESVTSSVVLAPIFYVLGQDMGQCIL